MKRHRFDPLSAVFGFLYTALGLRFLLGTPDFPDLDFNWIWPLAAVAIGIALIFSGRSTSSREEDRPS